MESDIKALATELQRVAVLRDEAFRVMRLTRPGSPQGATQAAIIAALDKRESALRSEIRAHPDHDYAGL